MKGKTAIITGASLGLGRQMALDLASRQMNLALAAPNQPELAQVGEEVEEKGGKALVQVTDVTDPEQCKSLIDETLKSFQALDYLVLSAGISMWAPFEQVTDVSIFRRLMEVNYLGAVHCIHAALPYLRKSRGTIVAISSAQAVMSLPLHSGYSASKHALRGFLEALELELGDEVRILNVLPGWIRGTSLRSYALSADGTSVGHTKKKHSKDSVSVEECSARIVQAMQGRARDLYIPSKLRLIPWLKLLAPGWLASKIRRAVEKQD